MRRKKNSLEIKCNAHWNHSRVVRLKSFRKHSYRGILDWMAALIVRGSTDGYVAKFITFIFNPRDSLMNICWFHWFLRWHWFSVACQLNPPNLPQRSGLFNSCIYIESLCLLRMYAKDAITLAQIHFYRNIMCVRRERHKF